MKRESVLISRLLRSKTTKAEDVFWDKVRNRKLNGLKFVRQYPITFKIENKDHFYIADFYCAKKKVIIEIDGKIHENQIHRDKLRTYVCKQLGYRTIRIKNDDILCRTEKTLEQLEKLI